MNKKEYCSEIVECLIKYGNLNKDDAQLMLAKSNICKNEEDNEWGMLDHEYPYYWAMHILYSKDNDQWFQNPSLWPPPKDYIEDWHRRRGTTYKETGSN